MVLKKKFKIPSGSEILKGLPNAKREWNRKSPLQKWCYFYGIGKAPFDLTKTPLFREDTETVHWFAYFNSMYSAFLIGLVFFTFYYKLSRGDLYSCLPCTCITGLYIANSPLVFGTVSKTRFKFAALIDFGGRCIYRDDHEDPEYSRICSEHMDATIRSFSIKMVSMFLSFQAALIGPAYVYLTDGIKTTTIEVRVPFTEEESAAELAVNFLLMSIVASHAGLLYVGIEVFMALFANIVTITPKLVKHELKKLSNEYEKRSISELQMRLRFNNVVKQSLDVENYVRSVSDALSWRNLLGPAAFTYAIAMSIFCQYSMGFAAGYGLAVMSWVQLFYICDLGENISDSGLAEMLYDINWEVFPPDIQMAIMRLIHQKQNIRGLTMGPFGVTIKRHMFQIATNKIYILVMFLKDFFN